LAPGTRLGEVELAAQLGVSRTPVREALRILSSQGLVEILPYKGSRVVQWSLSDVEEIYELRAMLESYAARRAATRISAEAIARLVQLCDQMDACAARGGEDAILELIELNTQFHRCILDAADSPRLESMLASVIHVPLAVSTLIRRSPEALARSLNHHRDLTAAMRARSPDWAASVMQSHVLASRSGLLQRQLSQESAGAILGYALGAEGSPDGDEDAAVHQTFLRSAAP
jgi:DNA-binding GntR family transcriptional regulator